MIKLKNLNKKFTKKQKRIIALNNITVEFEYGKFYAIMGCSGSGKTTLLNIIGLLDKPSSGFLYIDDINVANFSEKKNNEIRQKKIGYIFQECYLSENLNVFENIMLPLIINKEISINEKKIIVQELLDTIKLKERANHFPCELSGGEKQRVAIARSLVNNPSIVLADEPTGNLDNHNERMIFNMLKELAKEGKCVIVVSHSEEVKKYADKLIYMKEGILEDKNI